MIRGKQEEMMKRFILNEDNDGFSVQLRLDKRYLLSTQPEYYTQTIDLTQLIERNYLRKQGIRLKGNQEFEICFNKQETFSVYYGMDNKEGLRIKDYFDPTVDLNGNKVLLVNRRSLPDVLILDNYKLEVNEQADAYLVSARKTDTLTIAASEKSLIFLLNEKEAALEECLPIFQDIMCDVTYLMQRVKEVSFNCHIRRKGILDIYNKFSLDYSDLSKYGLEKAIKGYAQMSEENFYLLCESYIKMGLGMQEVTRKLPMFTNKPLPSPKNLMKLSKKTMDFIRNHFSERERSEQMEKFYDMEQNPKIGPNNVHMIIDFFDTLEKIENKYFINWSSGLNFNLHARELHLIGEIVNKFDCKVKNLIERSIRAIFQYNISPSNYFMIILDYYNLCEQLKIDLERKIPANVIALHDQYSLMVEDIENEKVKSKFREKTELNKNMLILLPEDEQYTIIVPEKTSDLIAEGTYLNHCVGSYVNRVADGSSKIFFLRKKDFPETPYVTIELTRENLLYQAKGFSNSRPCKEDMNYIYRWMDLIGGTYDK